MENKKEPLYYYSPTEGDKGVLKVQMPGKPQFIFISTSAYWEGDFPQIQHEKDLKKWQAECTRLSKYPDIEAQGVWSKTKDLLEGVHFKIERQYKNHLGWHLFVDHQRNWGLAHPDARRLVALPLTEKEEEKDQKVSLHEVNELFKTILGMSTEEIIGVYREDVVRLHSIKIAFHEYFGIEEDAPTF